MVTLPSEPLTILYLGPAGVAVAAVFALSSVKNRDGEPLAGPASPGP